MTNERRLRKALLIAESDINRMQMREHMTALNTGADSFTRRASAADLVASSAAALVTSLAAVQRGRTLIADSRLSRWQAVFNAAILVSTLWLSFRAHNPDHP